MSWPYLKKKAAPQKTDTVEIAWTTTVEISKGKKSGRLVEIVDSGTTDVRHSATTDENGTVSFELDQLALSGGVVAKQVYDIRVDGVVKERQFTPTKKSKLVFSP